MNYEVTPLAVAMHSNPGVYAVFLGSGVSKPAGIPSGWDIMMDLCRKVAACRGENCEPSPDQWYEQTFQKPIRYDTLLEEIGNTSHERTGILRSYFETAPEEAEQGLKQPTAAHRAIAWLVKQGFVKVIITTNFDRLMETALEDEGVQADVLWSEEQIEGARPLPHSPCALLKVNGDYLDSRFKNTALELEEYPLPIEQFLSRVFEDYGLIVAGWSAEWDNGLRNCMFRVKSRRYGWYWLQVGPLTESAKHLIAHRQATVVADTGADSFFKSLKSQIEALLTLDRRSLSLTPQMAQAMAKNFIRQKDWIGLHDMVHGEVDRILQFVISLPYNGRNEEFPSMVERITAECESLVQIINATCYFTEEEKPREYIRQALYQLISVPFIGGNSKLHPLRFLPVLLTFYSSGIASVAANHYKMLRSIWLEQPTVIELSASLPFLSAIQPLRLFSNAADGFKGLIQNKGARDAFLPAHQYLYETMKRLFHSPLSNSAEFDRCFYGFEFLYALRFYSENESSSYKYAPGLFIFDLGTLEPFLRHGRSFGPHWGAIEHLFNDGQDEWIDLMKRFDHNAIPWFAQHIPYADNGSLLKLYQGQ
ncbi:MAG: SIR2 family protein [Alicyclobacillus sp.]|nr:SIR2 family protein [Alicyclobacillus sp.]